MPDPPPPPSGLTLIGALLLYIACENYRPSSLPARVAFREERRLFSQAILYITIKYH